MITLEEQLKKAQLTYDQVMDMWVKGGSALIDCRKTAIELMQLIKKLTKEIEVKNKLENFYDGEVDS